MTTFSLASGLIAITLISGCAVKGNVVVTEPVDGLRTRIRVAAPDKGNSFSAPYRGVRAYPGSSCIDKFLPGGGNVVNPTAGFEKTLNDQQRGMPISAYSQDKHFRVAEFYAVANQPISLSYFRAGSQSSTYDASGGRITTYHNDHCVRSVQFIPHADADYEFIFDALGSCKVQVYQLETKDGQVLPTSMDIQPAPDCEVLPPTED